MRIYYRLIGGRGTTYESTNLNFSIGSELDVFALLIDTSHTCYIRGCLYGKILRSEENGAHYGDWGLDPSWKTHFLECCSKVKLNQAAIKPTLQSRKHFEFEFLITTMSHRTVFDYVNYYIVMFRGFEIHNNFYIHSFLFFIWGYVPGTAV